MDRDVHGVESTMRHAKEGIPGVSTYVSPFRRSDLKRIFSAKTKVELKSFINALNYHNFMSSHIFAVMSYPPANEEYLFRVDPSPCGNNSVTLSLPDYAQASFDAFEIKGIMIDNGDSVVVMYVDEPKLRSSMSLTVELKGAATQFRARQVKRHVCAGVDAVIQLPGVNAQGHLCEFQPSGLRVELEEDFRDAASTLKPGDSTSVHLFKDDVKIYSGTTTLVRRDETARTVVLKPLNIPIKRCQERRYRNLRLNPSPAPRITINHPLISKEVTYDLIDLNTSGFSIQERSDRSLLIPGMLFRTVEIIFSGELSLKCSAQVVYGKKQWGGMTKFGFIITDIDPISYTRLFNLLTRTDDPHSIASARVSLDSLWEFFFRSGFIYADKYQCISQYKKNFRATYEHLYHDCPEIFSSLTYQKNDQIFGHVSIIKAYPSTWMVHHLAALPMGRRRTGLYILHQILNYLDGFHRMPTIDMKHLVFYYRPENKFPNYFFGGVCRALDAPHMCSVDQFAYLNHHLPENVEPLPLGWDLYKCTNEDFASLRKAYNRHSQGLMIEAFCLESQDDALWKTYRNLGLKRDCNTYVLSRDGEQMAFFIVDRSDRGVNLSDLLNSIKIIIPFPDSRALPWRILQDAIAVLGRDYGTPEVVLQVFPYAYLDSAAVRYPKKYCMWIAKTKYFDPHFDAIKKMTRFKYIKFIKSIVEDMLGLH